VGKATVKFHGIVKGKEVEGASSGQGEKPLETHIVMLNGIGILPEKQLTTRVKEGDSVTIYLPVGGG
jgi:sulfur carrier protein ThiS